MVGCEHCSKELFQQCINRCSEHLLISPRQVKHCSLSAKESCLYLKILPPPALVHQPDQVFWAKRNTKHVNLEPSRRPPLPVCNRGKAWLIDFRTQTVSYLFGTVHFHLREGGRVQKNLYFENVSFWPKIYVNNSTYAQPCIIRAVVFDFQAV